ncbi:glutathione S-transferase [Cupriavidus basilensis]|uniref:Glutathione S-transferase n=1 Tax=Cupriavidus basilensis TaxID=68895 RepID=A0ABT6AQ12_9BURK|nr:glutathione S-transferase [Cupriavidus basilensis]MDF3834710.1 glutathione S-transferase [Cupriavidus basilensis]
MQLIGMLDSPYVRRVAISLRLLDMPFEHQPVSVFSTFEQFRAINPVVKAPTLVCDNGVVLMESGLILDYLETQAGRSLMPSGGSARQHALRIAGLALAACEKTVQIVYERNLRPAEKQHEPWLARVRGQLLAACSALETELAGVALPADERTLTQADVTTAVAWRFTQMMLPEEVDASAYPVLASFSAAAEQLAAFKDTPPL